jgi:hypothetical protein
LGKIGFAVTVLRASLVELNSSPEHNPQPERIEDALRTLKVVRRIELKISARCSGAMFGD